MAFTVDDLDLWPMGAWKRELIDGEIIFYGKFNEQDAARARTAFPDASVRLDEHGNLFMS